MNRKIIVCLILILALVVEYANGTEALSDYVVDSRMSWTDAMQGLDPECPEKIKRNQTLMDVVYYGMDGKVHWGQLLIDDRLIDDLDIVFREAYIAGFPFQSLIPISRFGWNDDASMASNNTSGFNYRRTTGGNQLSNHAYGFAVDINPLLNPYIKDDLTLPPGARYDPTVPGTLTEDHVIVKTFLELGWEWGGHWTSLKDYQHFEKVVEK